MIAPIYVKPFVKRQKNDAADAEAIAEAAFRHGHSGFCTAHGRFPQRSGFCGLVGLVPRQHSTGGKERLGRTSKMGQRDIRRLLIIGAMAVVSGASRKGAPKGTWLEKMMARKPRMLVAIALANKMARMVWAMMTKKEDYRDPAMTAA